jgi:hypothetical protein
MTQMSSGNHAEKGVDSSCSAQPAAILVRMAVSSLAAALAYGTVADHADVSPDKERAFRVQTSAV